MPVQMIEEWFQSHQEQVGRVARSPVLNRYIVSGFSGRLLLVSHSASIMDWLRVTVACSHLALTQRASWSPTRCAAATRLSGVALCLRRWQRAHFGVVATLAIRPWEPPFYEELSGGCGGVHGPTMKVELHENRHENLHGWRKIKESFRSSNTALGASR